MLQRIRHRLEASWKTTSAGFVGLLDSESVKLYVWPYYLTLWGFGVSSVISAVPLTFVAPVMGGMFYQVWYYMMIFGTTQVMLGLVIRNKNLGLWLQLGGNGSMALVLLAYEVAAYSIWGVAAFSFFAIAPYVLGCTFLALTVLRKLYLVERVKDEIDRGEEPEVHH